MSSKFLLSLIGVLVFLLALSGYSVIYLRGSGDPVLSSRHVLFDSVFEGDQVHVDLQVFNPSEYPIVLDSHRASCGCIAFEIPGNADIHELRIGQGQTVPVRVLIGTAGRYGQLTHHVALGFRTLETDKKFELRTAIELDIKANLRCSPPSLFLAKGKTATRGIIYSGTKFPQRVSMWTNPKHRL